MAADQGVSRSPSLYRKVAEDIKAAIAAGGYAAGTRLPSESELAERLEEARLLGVSPRVPMLRERRLTTDPAGTPVEWSDDRYRSAVAFSVHNSVAVNAMSRTPAG